MRSAIGSAFALMLLLTFSGCATNIATNSESAMLIASANPSEPMLVLSSDVRMRLRSGFRASTLAHGTALEYVGSIPQGSVHRSDCVFMVHTGNAHEAFLVVRDDHLVGVYLPVEKAFVASQSDYPIVTKEFSP